MNLHCFARFYQHQMPEVTAPLEPVGIYMPYANMFHLPHSSYYDQHRAQEDEKQSKDNLGDKRTLTRFPLSE